jgi:hypothetical protein
MERRTVNKKEQKPAVEDSKQRLRRLLGAAVFLLGGGTALYFEMRQDGTGPTPAADTQPENTEPRLTQQQRHTLEHAIKKHDDAGNPLTPEAPEDETFKDLRQLHITLEDILTMHNEPRQVQIGDEIVEFPSVDQNINTIFQSNPAAKTAYENAVRGTEMRNEGDFIGMYKPGSEDPVATITLDPSSNSFGTTIVIESPLSEMPIGTVILREDSTASDVKGAVVDHLKNFFIQYDALETMYKMQQEAEK